MRWSRQRCDWFAAGFPAPNLSHLIDERPDLFPRPQPSQPGRFHESVYRFQGGELRCSPKPGAANAYNELELRGQWFQHYTLDDLDGLPLTNPRPFRIDVAWDTDDLIDFVPALAIFPLLNNQPAEVRTWFASGIYTGFTYGSGDIRHRCYDKATEQKVNRTWWRYEVQIRGDTLKRTYASQHEPMAHGPSELAALELALPHVQGQRILFMDNKGDVPKWEFETVPPVPARASVDPDLETAIANALSHCLSKIRTAARAAGFRPTATPSRNTDTHREPHGFPVTDPETGQLL